ncbi:MAG: phage holin family protein [Actinobacteria bacterium]|nr:phage holin family protein [Actinomycetota bacterium]
MRFALRLGLAWLANVAALWVAVKLFGGVTSDGWRALVTAGLVFGVVNAVVKPVLLFVSFPLILLSLGVALLFINMAMLGVTDWLVAGFDIEGFWTYVGATVVVWLVNAVLEALFNVD